MKLIMKSAAFAAVLLGLSVGSAHAQDTLRVKVPFPFVVDTKTFPAGQYSIRTVQYGGSVVSIEGAKGQSAAAFVLTMNAAGSDPAGNQPSLVFTCDDNHYRLSEIWESDTEGRELSAGTDAHKIVLAETPSRSSQTAASAAGATCK